MLVKITKVMAWTRWLRINYSSATARAKQVITMSDTSSSHLCFTYGTLKRGQPNHHVLLEADSGKAEYVTSGHTVNKYPLVISGQYNIPFLLYVEGKGNNIQGDVFRVDDMKRDFLDDFESHPSFYERMLTDIVVPHETDEGKTKTIQCWAYFLKAYKPEMLQLEMFASYDSHGPHGLRYVERYKRAESAFEAFQKS